MTSEDIKLGALALNNMKLDELLKVDSSNGSDNIQTKREMGANSEASDDA